MPGLRWTEQEIGTLLDQISREHRLLPAIQVPGKSSAAINNQRRRLKAAGLLEGAFAGRELSPWRITELNELKKLTEEYHFSAALIAQLELIPGRSRDAVSKMMFRHGLGDPIVKLRARQAHRLSHERRYALDNFLSAEGRLTSSKEIAQRWGIAEQTVNGYRRRLHTQLSWKEARASEQHKKRQHNIARTFSLRLCQRWEAWRARREQRLRQLKLELARRASPPPARECQMCGEAWFATMDFFYVTRKSAGNDARKSMSHTCRLCQSVRGRGANHPKPSNLQGAAA